MKFHIVQVVDGKLAAAEIVTDDAPAAFEIRGFTLTGIESRSSLRPELRGQPKFQGLYGPMWGGNDEAGAPIIRYESPAAYEILSRVKARQAF